MKKIALSLIRWYQEKISKQTNPKCRHSPTCSNYGLIAYKRFNFFKASFFTLKRVLSCNPLFKPKYDPVPEKVFSLKKEFLVTCLTENQWTKMKHEKTIEIKEPFMSINDFLKKTASYDLIEERLVIVCVLKNKVVFHEIDDTEGNLSYLIEPFDGSLVYDTLIYQTDEKGKYLKNKAFKKY